MTNQIIGLLHTAEAHCARFDAILTDVAPGKIGWVHGVHEGLLRQTLSQVPTDRIAGGIAAAIAELRAQGARQILCTCSTIGGLAEQVGRQIAVPTLRVDRPMAEVAVNAGRRILVVACLPSTLEPTTGLLNEVAHAQGRRIEVETLLVESAWPLFQAGDEDGFAQQIAAVIHVAQPYPDAIVLAQASMARVADLLEHLPVPVFASPRLGAVEAVRRLTASLNTDRKERIA